MKVFAPAVVLALAAAVQAKTFTTTRTNIVTVDNNGNVIGGATSSSESVATTLSTSVRHQHQQHKAASTVEKESTVADTTTSTTPTTTSTSSTKSSSTSSTKTSSTAAATTSASSDLDDFQQEILDAHNEKRALHSADDLVWDNTLYEYASDYASSYDCSGSLTHSGGEYGENLAVGYKSGTAAVEAWYSEGEDYDYSSSSSFDHFTQIIWKSTTKLGCAKVDCSSNNWGLYIICSYDPAGNVVGAGKANLASS